MKLLKHKRLFSIMFLVILLATVLVVPLSVFATGHIDDLEPIDNALSTIDGSRFDHLYSSNLRFTSWQIHDVHNVNYMIEIDADDFLISYTDGSIPVHTYQGKYFAINGFYDGIDVVYNANYFCYYSNGGYTNVSYDVGSIRSVKFYSDYTDTITMLGLLKVAKLTYQPPLFEFGVNFIVDTNYVTDVGEFMFEINSPMNSIRYENSGYGYNRYLDSYSMGLYLSPYIVAPYLRDNGEYYYELFVRYNSYIPYIMTYNKDGEFIGTIELDGQHDEVYLTGDNTYRLVAEYDPEVIQSARTVRIKLVLREYNHNLAYEKAYEDGYDDGYDIGYGVGTSESFGDNLLGDTLLAPVHALQSIVLYTTSSGFPVTLWFVFSTCVGVGLLIWFLKLFAGG